MHPTTNKSHRHTFSTCSCLHFTHHKSLANEPSIFKTYYGREKSDRHLIWRYSVSSSARNSLQVFPTNKTFYKNQTIASHPIHHYRALIALVSHRVENKMGSLDRELSISYSDPMKEYVGKKATVWFMISKSLLFERMPWIRNHHRIHMLGWTLPLQHLFWSAFD